MIELERLYKYYGDRRALGPVDATIERGEIVGFLGLNGAGKTTTLRILAGDLLPTSGRVRVGGLDLSEDPLAVRRLTGYLPDRPPLYDEMRVEEYLRFTGGLRGMSGKRLRERLATVVHQVELGAVLDDPISSLSHGFRKRVGIAQAILHEPELVLLDEPISGLDPKQIVEMRELLRGLRGKHTVLVSSHILTEVTETCDRVLILDRGEVIAAGTPSELTATLQRGALLHVVIEGGGDEVNHTRALLHRIDGVVAVRRESDVEEEGVAAFFVEATRDVRADVARKLLGGGVTLLELRPSQRALEELFLQLSDDRAAQRGEEPKT